VFVNKQDHNQHTCIGVNIIKQKKQSLSHEHSMSTERPVVYY